MKRGKKQTDEDEEPQLYSLTLATDSDNFQRRTCPTCGLDFKTEVDPDDTQWMIATQFRRVEPEAGEQSEVTLNRLLYCPYCEHKAESSDTQTEETVAYVHRFIRREVITRMVNEAFSEFGQGSRRSTDFISISVSYDTSTLPPRPLHGPELPDMCVIEFLCCHKKIKVSEQWISPSCCTYCGTPVAVY